MLVMSAHELNPNLSIVICKPTSDISSISVVQDLVDDSMETLIGMSSEPAVEDLSRQIMSEAKLWEAIQEASAELSRRRKAGH